MSGGDMGYLYRKVATAEFAENTALRRVFRKHLHLVARALRAIEWNDSGDGDHDEDADIAACLKGVPRDALRQMKAQTKREREAGDA